MCTLSAVVDAHGLCVTMNRDELDSRERERPLAVHGDAPDRQWIGPVDARAGGTWIGANAHGVVAALLNGYMPRDAQLRDAPTRGGLVVAALAHARADRAADWIGNEHDVTQYASFTLVLADLETVRAFDWDGQRLVERRPPWPRHDAAMYTSSSWAGASVARRRQEAFSKWLAAARPLTANVPSFHLQGRGAPREWTPLMAREHARTRSITTLRVTKGGVEGQHWLVDAGEVDLAAPVGAAKIRRLGSLISL